MSQTIRILLIGLGNLGWRFCDLLADKGPEVAERYGLQLTLVGAADSRGAASDPGGLDPASVAALKRAGGTIADLCKPPAGFIQPPGRPIKPAGGFGQTGLDLIAQTEADLLCEASPVNLRQGAEPGLSHVRSGLERGLHVVTPNKGPLVLAYRELHDLAARRGVQLRFDGTVAGGLPALYIGQRDLRGGIVQRIEAVPNLVTGYVLEMLGDGLCMEDALEQATAAGTLEADPSFDLDGWDAAAKLVILVNAVMGIPARLEDVACSGIGAVQGADVRAARRAGRVYRLLATAERRTVSGGVSLRVAPTALPATHWLAHLGRMQMGVVYHTDIYGTILAAIDEPTPLPSAATMLRDVLDIYGAL